MPAGSGVIRYAGKRGVVWRIKFADADGKQVMETVGAERDGMTRKQAEAELRERLVKVERRGWRKPAPLTFAGYAERWFAEGEAKRGWKPRTVLQYRTVHERLVKTFGPTPLAAVRPRDVAAYVRKLSEGGMAPATIARDLAVLSALFKSARREKLVEGNPAEAAERPKVKRRRWRILEPAEVQRVAQAFTDAQARTVFLTLVLLGLRRPELQALRWRDIDLLEGTLRVVESKSEAGERSIAIPATLLEALGERYRTTAYKGDEQLVFCHPTKGGTYNAETFAEALRAALKAAGVEAELRPFHDLRHASLTNGAAAGESPIALMTRAGHSNMQTTKLFLHLAGTVFRDEADALERRLLGGRLGLDDQPETSPDEHVLKMLGESRGDRVIDRGDRTRLIRQHELKPRGTKRDLDPKTVLVEGVFEDSPGGEIVQIIDAHEVESSTRLAAPSVTSHDVASLSDTVAASGNTL